LSRTSVRIKAIVVKSDRRYLLIPPPLTALQHVDKNKQAQPNHIDKMPIPSRRLKRKMIVGSKMIFEHNPQPNNAQKQRT
jgi:hypothetical protein